MPKQIAERPVDRTGRLITLGVGLLFVLGLAALIIMSFMRQNAPVAAPVASPTPTEQPRPTQTPGIHFKPQGHSGHDKTDPNDPAVAGFKYNSDPPTSGMHLEQFAGSLLNGKPLPKWMQVHLLEHGNILLQYNCTCPDIAGALAQTATSYNNRQLPAGQTQFTEQNIRDMLEVGKAVIVAPYPHMRYKIALTAWTRLEPLDSFDAGKVTKFIDAYLTNADNAAQ